MLNLEWFRTFKAIYETGNLTAAAQSLYISQSGVSLHLSSLETFTGYPLFDRETRKMIPTERGAILYNFILDPLTKLVDAEESFFRNSTGEKPTLSVGMGFETFEYTLEEHLEKLPFNLILRVGEYSQMLHDLHTGTLDLILTPKIGKQTNLHYTAFTKERIILVCGSNTNVDSLNKLIITDDRLAIRNWLKKQVWYTTTDMEHLNNFWLANFDCLPDVKPNYIVPYCHNILRCLKNSNGFAVMPDFLCKKQITNNKMKMVWEGNPHVENTLHFAKRKKSIYANEIQQLESLLTNRWLQLFPEKLF